MVEPEPEETAEQSAEQETAPKDPEPDPIEVAREEAKRIREQMLRIAADFENFRKRARRESEDAARRAREDILRELLPVFDNLERAVSHAEQSTEPGAVASGVKIVLKQFHDTIGKLGVARVTSLGEPFDPNFHEAIQQMESADQPAGTVVAEVLPGYRWGDRLLRAAMVVVAKAPGRAHRLFPSRRAEPVEALLELPR